MKNIALLCILMMYGQQLSAQNIISGTVVSVDGLSLPGAGIFVLELNKAAIADQNGKFVLSDVPSGIFHLQFSYVGFANHLTKVDTRSGNQYLTVTLLQASVETEEIVISGGYNTSQHQNAVKIDVLKLAPMNTSYTPNFTASLQKVAGIDMISKGSGVSKPVIRGLSMNDILILNQGIRLENYQYSSHHPMGIDEFGLDEVEIIKGPASVLYGSDAIGGVINFIKEKPAAVGTYQAEYNLRLHSNSLGITNNLGFKGSGSKWYGGFRIGNESNADYLQGQGAFVPNTRFATHSAHGFVGHSQKSGSYRLYYDFLDQKLGLAEEEAIAEITSRGRVPSILYQHFTTQTVSLQSSIYHRNLKTDLNLSFQNTRLAHMASVSAFELQMGLSTLSYEAKMHLPGKSSSEWVLGMQGYSQFNRNINQRETILLPDAFIQDAAVFGLVKRTFHNQLTIQSGVRLDYKGISTQAIGDTADPGFREAMAQSYPLPGGSAGVTWEFSKFWLVRANIASAYRTPNLAELTSKGVHEFRFEMGDRHLLPENAVETDINLHCHKPNLTFDLAAYYNHIHNYIMLQPTHDSVATGERVYRYGQAEAILFGGEAGIHLHPQQIHWLHIESSYSYVMGRETKGGYLPFVPAAKFQVELRAEFRELGKVKKAFLSLGNYSAFGQYHTAVDETATPGYALFSMSVGCDLPWARQLISIMLSGSNLFDTKFVDHLSTLKEVSMSDPGRNIALSIRMPINGALKKNQPTG